MYCGWLDPVELTDPCAVSNMPALEDQPVAYLVRNSSGSFPGEYYLLENRQQKGWDEYSPAHGMLVLHVDFDADAWAANEVNATYAHQRMTIVPADNRLTRATMGGDTWPGTTNNTALTDTSTPSARLYNANADGRKFLGHPITEISEADGMVSFLFDGGFVVGTPTLAVLPESITATGFRVEWTAMDEATDYEVRLTRVDAEGHAVSTLYYLTASTFLVFDGLEAGASYAVSVRARQDGVPGDWYADYGRMDRLCGGRTCGVGVGHYLCQQQGAAGLWPYACRHLLLPLPHGLRVHGTGFPPPFVGREPA